MNSSNLESALYDETTDTASDEAKPVAMPYLGESLPVGLVGAATVAAFVLLLDVLSGHPLGTPNALAAGYLRGDMIPLTAPIQPGLVLGYTLLHVATFVFVGAAAVSAEFTLSRAGIAPSIQLVLGTAGLMSGLTVFMITLMSLVGIEAVSGFGLERILSVNAIAALAMAITVHMRGETRRLERAAAERG